MMHRLTRQFTFTIGTEINGLQKVSNSKWLYKEQASRIKII